MSAPEGREARAKTSEAHRTRAWGWIVAMLLAATLPVRAQDASPGPAAPALEPAPPAPAPSGAPTPSPRAPSSMADFIGEPAGYRELIVEAVSEYEAGHFEEARALFRQAHELFPNARTLRGLGMAEFELRNYGESIRYLDAALLSNVRPLEGELRTSTEQLCARARRFVAQLDLRVEPQVATVIVDGVPVTFEQGSTLVLEVGDHVLEIRADDYVPERRVLAVRGGEAQTLHVVLTPLDGSSAQIVLRPSNVPRSRLAGGLALSGIGPLSGYALKTAGFGAAGTLWLIADAWAFDARVGIEVDVREELRDYVHVPLELGAYRLFRLGDHALFAGGGAGVSYVWERAERTRTEGVFLVTTTTNRVQDELAGVPLFARVGVLLFSTRVASLVASLDYVITFGDFEESFEEQALRGSLSVLFRRMRR